MDVFITAIIAYIVLFHIYVFVLETFLWEQPKTRQAFGTTPETAATTKALAANQGVYNLFLAAGLAWSLVASDVISFPLQVFFLGCILVAALTAGLVVSKRIMLIQGFPALVALTAVIINH